MPPKSKQPKLNELKFDKADRQLMFRYLPLHILRQYTNIRQLIINKYVAQKEKTPTEFHIKQTVKNYHNKIIANDWKDPLFEHLDFIWPNGEKRYQHTI